MKILGIRRSSFVVLSVVLQRLTSDTLANIRFEENLVLEALRMSNHSLADASIEELKTYITAMSGNEFRGLVSLVKGKYHEILFTRAENLDGDEVSALMKEALNHPGSDVEFLIDGEVISEVQLKAVKDPATIFSHFEKYPDVPVYATSEIANRMDGVNSSNFSNDDLQQRVEERLNELKEEGIINEVSDGLLTSALVTASISVASVLRGKNISRGELIEGLKDLGTATVAATVMDTLLYSIS